MATNEGHDEKLEPSNSSDAKLGEISYSFLVAPEPGSNLEDASMLVTCPPQYIDEAVKKELQGIHDVLENYLAMMSAEVVASYPEHHRQHLPAATANQPISPRLRQDSLGAAVRDSKSAPWSNSGTKSKLEKNGRFALLALPVLLSPLLIGLLGLKLGLFAVAVLLVLIVCRI